MRDLLTEAEITELLDRVGTRIERRAQEAFERLAALLRAGAMLARDAVALVQAEFGMAFEAELGAAFSALLQRSVGPLELRALPVGPVQLSGWLYAHAADTARAALRVITEHAAGMLQARELALRLYDGYSPRDGIQRPLEGRVRARLPQALRALTTDPRTRISLDRQLLDGQKRAARLKTAALRAAYGQAFSAWEDGEGHQALKRRLWVAQREANRYAANRLAQTELARAHSAQRADEFMADPDVEVVRFKLNPVAAREPDICDLFARADMYRLGAGAYPKALAPMPPLHPHCRCALRSAPSLSGMRWSEVENGAQAWLRKLPMRDQGRIAGSMAKASAVLDGASIDDVINADRDPVHQVMRMGLRRPHPLVGG